MATIEDAQWAQDALSRFDARFSRHADAKQSLRDAKVAESRIQTLYPFDVRDYEAKLAQAVCAGDMLYTIIGKLLLMNLRDVFSLVGMEELKEDLRAVEYEGDSILSAILSLPDKARPGQFILRVQHYPEDFLAAFRLVKKPHPHPALPAPAELGESAAYAQLLRRCGAQQSRAHVARLRHLACCLHPLRVGSGHQPLSRLCW